MLSKKARLRIKENRRLRIKRRDRTWRENERTMKRLTASIRYRTTNAAVKALVDADNVLRQYQADPALGIARFHWAFPVAQFGVAPLWRT